MLQSQITKKFLRCEINGCVHKFTSHRGIFNHCVLKHKIRIIKIGQYRYIREFNYSRIPWHWITDVSFKKFILLRKIGWKCQHCGFNKRRPDGGIVLELDHIDGNHMNNEKSNLRILCLNCHAMTPNFRNWGNKKNKVRSTRNKQDRLRIKKYNDRKKMKFHCSNRTLRDLVWKYGCAPVAKYFEVSHTTIRRRLIKGKIPIPPRGEINFRLKEYIKIFGKELDLARVFDLNA